MSELQALVDRTAASFGLPGLSAAWKGGGKEQTAQAGLGRPEPQFPIASVTKPYTACRVVELAGPGVIDLAQLIS